METEKELQDVINIMMVNKDFRKSLATRSFRIFFGTYFSHYIKFPLAECHLEMFRLAEDPNNRTIVIMGARGIAKSTIMNMALAIWSILGSPQKHCIVILGRTQTKAKRFFLDLRKEFEENELLRADLGPFKTQESEWSSSLTIPRHNVKITFASAEQSVRGIRHKQYRPDLIIGDDLEDDSSVRTMEGRNRTYDWLVKDVIPSGEFGETRLVILGTLLHEDSLIMRLQEEIANGQRDGIYRKYPLMDDNGKILWKGKYPDNSSINEERRRVGNEVAWGQEYLLRIVSTPDRVVYPEWIKYYDNMPEKTEKNEYRGAYIGIDLAISEKEYSDYTAMVSAHVFGWGDDMKIYIAPNPIKERLDFPSAIEKAKLLSSSLADRGRFATLYIENNQYQEAFVQMMQKEKYPAQGIHSQGDKRTRLTLVTPLVKAGRIMFSRTNNESLVQELTGFGSERHDDLADAFAIVIGEIMKNNHGRPGSIIWGRAPINYGPDGERNLGISLKMRF
jgi:predicted phage terminase large subunit-like protein